MVTIFYFGPPLGGCSKEKLERPKIPVIAFTYTTITIIRSKRGKLQ